MTTSTHLLLLYRYGIPLLITAVYVAGIEWLVGWPAVISAWRGLDTPGILVGVLLMAGSYLARAWRSKDYFQPETAGSHSELVRITVVHNMLNLVLPMRSGELSFPMMMKRTFGIGFSRSSVGLVWFRVMDLHTLVSILLLSHVISGSYVAVTSSFWLLMTVIPIILFRFRASFERLAHRWLSSDRLTTLVKNALSGLPKNVGMFVKCWLWTLLNWTLKFAALVWLLGQFAPASLTALTTGVIGGEMTSVLPIHTPGGIGTYEAGVAAGLALYSVPYDSAITGAVNMHLFLLSVAIASGLAGLVFTPQTDRIN